VKIASGVLPGFIILVSMFSAAQQQQLPTSQPASTAKTSTAKKGTLKAKPVLSTQGTILLSADSDCSVKIDDGNVTDISASKPTSVKLGLGEHLIVASSLDGVDTWRQVINLDKPSQKVILIALLPMKQAREQDQAAKAELDSARAQESADEAQAARAKQERMQADAARKQAADQQRQQIADLRSQISDLQDDLSQAEDQATQDDQSVETAESECAEARLQPGVPCVAMMTANIARADALSQRQKANELKEQIRELERQIQDLQNQ
jgi:polyhydroxyalkanoate synthesis regulator phasin